MDTNQQRELLEQEMLDQSSRLKTLRYAVLDMLEDFIAEDVMEVNLHCVQPKLDQIIEARRHFSSAVEEYKGISASSYDGDCLTLQNQLEEMNQQVEQHADSIRFKVEQLQGQQILFCVHPIPQLSDKLEDNIIRGVSKASAGARNDDHGRADVPCPSKAVL